MTGEIPEHLRPRNEDGYLPPKPREPSRGEVIGYSEFIARLYGEGRDDEADAMLESMGKEPDSASFISDAMRKYLGYMGH